MFFSKNTKRENKYGIKNLFGAQVTQQHEKYIGLPPMVRREKKIYDELFYASRLVVQ